MREQSSLETTFSSRDSDAVKRLISSRSELLTKLETQYGALVRSLSALATKEAEYLEKVRQTANFLEDELFWVRSSPPMGIGTVRKLPTALTDLFGRKPWVETGGATATAFAYAPMRITLLMIALAALLLGRKQIAKSLRQSGEQTHRISTDRYGHTAQALLFTLLLSLPLPLMLISAAWALKQPTYPSELVRAVQSGFQMSAAIAFVLLFMNAICWPGGLGERHFRWRTQVLKKVRFVTRWFAAILIPTFLVIRMSFTGETGEHFDSLGRDSYILSLAFSTWLLWKLFQPAGGILAGLMRARPRSLTARSARHCYALAIVIPAVLLILALTGYLYTAVVLSLEFVTSAAIIGTGAILYWLTLRWFMIRERQLALAEAIEERRARNEAAATARKGEVGGEHEKVVTIEVKEEELDLSSIGNQTRHLLRFLCGLGVVLGLGYYWSQTIPLFSALDKINILGSSISLFDLAKAILVVAVTMMASRNLQGILELAVLRGLEIQPGTRVAIVTLCQYALWAAGLAFLFNVLEVEWAKFGWIAAALSVGIGFGLQEIVANFVCGLILLFERPIRVGDIVTVDGTTGTVSKIQLRATTIINWDRQELVVPNKNFATGTILNWTLNTTVNRIVIAIGVAYGSDTEKARQILLDVATDHPVVLEDPAPLATFEEFGDSSLNLILRCYLPNMDNRVTILTELNTEIDRRFAEAGIEIPFPQRDLHLRSVDSGVELGGK